MSSLDTSSLPRRRRALAVAASCAGLALAVAGCASGGEPQVEAERITVTETPTTPVTPSASPTSDVAGRSFDVGTISSATTVDGTVWIKLDRWTVKGTSDAKLAKDGITIAPHTAARFTNQNDDRLRSVPLAPGATVVVNTCKKTDDDRLGLTSTPESATDWLDDLDSKAVLLLTYDDSGRIVRMDTDPRC